MIRQTEYEAMEEKGFSLTGTVTIDRDGREYSARYLIIHGLLTITGRHGCKAAWLAGSNPEQLAAALLGDLVQERGQGRDIASGHPSTW